MIKTSKSIYDKPGPEDGERVLVMSKWPRGVSKGRVDLWMKDLGTPLELVHAWKEGRMTWPELSKRYVASLKGKEPLLQELAEKSKKGAVTLLCTDKDEERCHRSLLRREIERLL